MKLSFTQLLTRIVLVTMLLVISSIGLQSVTAQGTDDQNSNQFFSTASSFVSSLVSKNAQVDLVQSPNSIIDASDNIQEFNNDSNFPNTILKLNGDTLLRDLSIAEKLFISSESTSGNDAIGNLNIGYTGISQISSDAAAGARLQVGGPVGTIKVGDLSDPTDPNLYCVCSDSFGVMKRCGVYDPANGLTCEGNSCLDPDVLINYNGSPFNWDENIIYDINLNPLMECTTDNPQNATTNSCTLINPMPDIVPETPTSDQDVNKDWFTVVMDSPIPQWYRVQFDYNLLCESGDSTDCGVQPIEGVKAITRLDLSSESSDALIPGSCDEDPVGDPTEPVNGQCAAFPDTYSSQPATNTTNGCIEGTYSDTGDTATQWQWECQGSNGGTTSSCTAEIETVTEPEDTYAWVIGNWGSCSPSTEAQCTGTPDPVSGEKLDWNGLPFEWVDGVVYRGSDGVGVVNCITDGSTEYDLTAGENMDTNAASGGDACITVAGHTWQNQYYYEPSIETGNWQRIRLLDSSPMNGQIQSITEFNMGPIFSTPPVVACDGDENSCETVAGCTWIPETDSSQTRNVSCQNQDGQVANDSLCPEPKPLEERLCLVSIDPIETTSAGEIYRASCQDDASQDTSLNYYCETDAGQWLPTGLACDSPTNSTVPTIGPGYNDGPADGFDYPTICVEN